MDGHINQMMRERAQAASSRFRLAKAPAKRAVIMISDVIAQIADGVGSMTLAYGSCEENWTSCASVDPRKARGGPSMQAAGGITAQMMILAKPNHRKTETTGSASNARGAANGHMTLKWYAMIGAAMRNAMIAMAM